MTQSRWISEGELCFDSLSFTSNTNYFQLYCDTDYTERGKYVMIKDTLILTSFAEIELGEKQLNESNNKIIDQGNLTPISIAKYLVKNVNKMDMIYFKDLNSGYESKMTSKVYNRIQE